MPSPHRTREIARQESGHTTVKTVVASVALTADDSGKLIVVDLVAGSDTTITLPTAEPGLTYRIIVWKDDDGDDDLIVVTASTSSLFKGGVVHDDEDNAYNVSVQADFSNDDTWTFVDAKVGTDVTFICDGTHWYTTGQVISTTVPTIL